MTIASKIKYSFIYPVRNRVDLLMRGLESLMEMDYPKSGFEVVIVDYMSDDDLASRILRFRGFLNIQYICVDLRRYKHRKVFMKDGRCNPALAQNIGARQARGQHIILTSPEILHWKKNLSILDATPELSRKMVYGKVIEREEHEVFSMGNPFGMLNQMTSEKVLCDWINHLQTPTLYFIGVIPRDLYIKYGGIDEAFMSGIAYEDEDFGNRLKNMPDLELVFDKEVFGVHLTHDRAYQEVSAVMLNKAIMDDKVSGGRSWADCLTANAGYQMGDFDTIIQHTRMWRY